MQRSSNYSFPEIRLRLLCLESCILIDHINFCLYLLFCFKCTLIFFSVKCIHLSNKRKCYMFLGTHAIIWKQW